MAKKTAAQLLQLGAQRTAQLLAAGYTGQNGTLRLRARAARAARVLAGDDEDVDSANDDGEDEDETVATFSASHYARRDAADQLVIYKRSK
ncbi:MAG: hypothetical protein P4L68_10805 [Methylovirgula sp.]|nr:hypothetical protein [Methylovirgula sp.]